MASIVLYNQLAPMKIKTTLSGDGAGGFVQTLEEGSERGHAGAGGNDCDALAIVDRD